MSTINAASSTVGSRVAVHVLRSVTTLLAASAGIILFVVIPYVVLERVHMLPDWEAMNFIFILFPIVIAWIHAGLYMTLVVVACEAIIVKLNPFARNVRIEAIAKITVCVVVYLVLYLANRFNFH